MLYLIGRDIKCYEGLISEVAEIFDRAFGILERLGTMKKGKREIEERCLNSVHPQIGARGISLSCNEKMICL